MSQSDVEYAKQWIPAVMKTNVEDNRLNTKQWKRTNASALKEIRNKLLRESGVQNTVKYQQGFDALNQDDKDKITNRYGELHADKKLTEYDPWGDEESEKEMDVEIERSPSPKRSELNINSIFYPPIKDKPKLMSHKIKGLDDFLAGREKGVFQGGKLADKLGMDELKTIVGELSQRINRKVPLMTVAGGQEYLAKKYPNKHKEWGVVEEDLNPYDDDPTPNVMWYTPDKKLYAIDGWTTRQPRAGDYEFDEYVRKHPLKKDRIKLDKDGKNVGSHTYLKNQAKAARNAKLSLYERFRYVVTDPIVKERFVKGDTFADKTPITGDLIAPLMGKLASFVKKNYLLRDMLTALNPAAAAKYQFSTDKNNLLGKNKKLWITMCSRKTDDEMVSQYENVVEKLVDDYIARNGKDFEYIDGMTEPGFFKAAAASIRSAESASASASSGALDIEGEK